jgi:hypothetical protein
LRANWQALASSPKYWAPQLLPTLCKKNCDLSKLKEFNFWTFYIHLYVLFCFQASLYSSFLKTLISVSTVALLCLIVTYHVFEVQVL